MEITQAFLIHVLHPNYLLEIIMQLIDQICVLFDNECNKKIILNAKKLIHHLQIRCTLPSCNAPKFKKVRPKLCFFDNLGSMI